MGCTCDACAIRVRYVCDAFACVTRSCDACAVHAQVLKRKLEEIRACVRSAANALEEEKTVI